MRLGGSATDVSLTWTAQAGMVEYTVYRSTNRDGSGAVALGRTPVPLFTDAGARVFGKPSFYYRVRGRNACGVEGL